MSTASVERQVLDVPADDGSPIYEFKISSGDLKIQLICLSYGATITKLMAPDRKGASENIALCYESVQDIKLKLGPYYGSVPGRFANRIARGKFRLDGEDHQLATNNGLNSLHGGTSGFDKKNWTAAEFAGSDGVGVQFSYISPDKEEGYPGELHVDVTYMLNNSNELVMDYSAIVVGKATVLNLTNHTYFNLSGNCRRKILDHKLQLSCSCYLPATSELLPTGEILSVQNSLFDFLSSVDDGKVLGDALPLIDGGGRPGLDHCFVVDGYADAGGGRAGAEPTLQHVATLTDELSGRQVVCHSSMPAVQVYTANWLPSEEDIEGQGQHPHVQHNAVCLETQHFPDSPNQPSFPSTVLRPGEKYRHRSVFSFRTVA